jgi:hypothetical protein
MSENEIKRKLYLKLKKIEREKKVIIESECLIESTSSSSLSSPAPQDIVPEINDEIENFQFEDVLSQYSEEVNETSLSSEDNTENEASDDDTESDKFFNVDFKKLGDSELNIRECLRMWSLHYGIPRDAVDSMLNILVKKGDLELPLTNKTLVRTPTNKITTEPMAQSGEKGFGEFYYWGIQNQIRNLNYKFLKSGSLKTIKFDVGIDGLSPFQSSAFELWPILLSFHGIKNIPPFIVAAYWGKGKPKSSDDFLEKFVEEIKNLIELGGIEVDGERKLIKKFEIHLFGCDAPAKSFIKRVQGHTGFHSCNFCKKTSEVIFVMGVPCNVSNFYESF